VIANVTDPLGRVLRCLLWQQLFGALFPHCRVRYLFASRKCLLQPSPSYLDYFRSVWQPSRVIVDLFSTGASWARLFARLNARGRCWFIGRMDNYAYLPNPPRVEDWLDVSVVFCNSGLGSAVNKNVEMLNYAPHGVVEDVLCLPGGVALPVLAQSLEYDVALPEAAHRSFRACVEAVPHYPELPRLATGALGDLIRDFVRLICADQQLLSIYA
jgi:hypothetical protein